MTAKIPNPFFTQEKRCTDKSRESLQRYQAEFCLNDVARQKHSVFQIDESSLRPTTEKRSHWSIAWSDLMMTMFILFLSLFVYQAAHKDFLMSNDKEIVAGETEEILEISKNSNASFPFVVIKPSAPLITSGTVKKAESITLQDIDLDSTFSPADSEKTLAELKDEIPQVAMSKIETKKPVEKTEVFIPPKPIETVVQPLPLGITTKSEESVNSLYSQSQITLDTYKLNEFASIDLLPDKVVRIILTGDLLFQTGDAALSQEAIFSLEKIAAVISATGYQIHVEGHTDDIPIHSGRYTNNWELSFARANAVANFLIEDMGMGPEQFVISGYSSYRPVAPNTSSENRATNRRVEIVISQVPAQIKDTTIASSLSFNTKS